MLFCKVVFWVFFCFCFKVICEQCNNSLDRNQNNLQYLFYFPSATTHVTAIRNEKNQNVHSSLPHATEISENIYIEHAKKLWSGDNWGKHSKLIPTPVAQAVFRLANCLDWQNWIFGAEHLALKTWPHLLCAFLRFSHWISSSLLLCLECLLVVGAHLLIKFHPRGIHFACSRIALWCEPKHEMHRYAEDRLQNWKCLRCHMEEINVPLTY